MQLKSILLAATAVSSALAAPTLGLLSIFSQDKVPGYPLGNGFCLSDQQAAFIVKTFKSILTNPDRKGAIATANIIIADKYVETSDSINVLAGYPVSFISSQLRLFPADFYTSKVALLSMANRVSLLALEMHQQFQA